MSEDDGKNPAPAGPTPGLKLTALTPADAAKALSAALGRRVTESQVRAVAQAGDLLRPDDTLNLLDYVAFLISEVTHAPSPAHSPDA
jgi:hypothetical protein